MLEIRRRLFQLSGIHHSSTQRLKSRAASYGHHISGLLLDVILASYSFGLLEGSNAYILYWWRYNYKDPVSILGKQGPMTEFIPGPHSRVSWDPYRERWARVVTLYGTNFGDTWSAAHSHDQGRACGLCSDVLGTRSNPACKMVPYTLETPDKGL